MAQVLNLVAPTAFRLVVATAADTVGQLAASGATGDYLAGVTGAIPAWTTLNQAAVAGLTTASSPTFAGLTLTAPLTVPNGGTGVATLTANGPLYGNAAGVILAAAAGATGQYVAGTTGLAPAWAILNQAAVAGLTTASTPTFAGLVLTAPLTVLYGGTGVATLAAGGVLYGNGAGVALVTAIGAANSVLTHNGTVPSFSATPTLTSLTLTGALTLGTDLTVANGGTGASTFASNGVLYGNGASAIAVTAQGAANTVLTANAGAPAFSATPTVTTLTTTGLLTAGNGLTVSAGALTVSGVGPHAIGGAASADAQLILTGAWAKYMGLSIQSTITPPDGALTPRMFDLRATLNPPAGADAFGVYLAPTLNKAGSGTHGLVAGMYVAAPTIGAGAAALTDAVTVYIAGAPTVGTNKYALWVAAGGVRLGGLGAFAASDKYVIADANGNLHVSALGPAS